MHLMAEDPTIHVQGAQPDGQVIIGCGGELQLEIIVDRLSREFNVEASVGRPEVVYVRSFPAGSAAPVILEPLMRVDVDVPQEHHDDVVRDLIDRRGRILSQEEIAGRVSVRALVPLSELFGYSGYLRELTRGRAACSLNFDRYQQVDIDPSAGGDDRGSPVGAPLKPAPRPNESAVAVPEPDEDG